MQYIGEDGRDMIFLHIGRHKTGTSAIQMFLKRNQSRLASVGYGYPSPMRGGRAHHDLANALNNRGSGPPGGVGSEAHADEVRHFRELLSGEGNWIVSSEMFQNVVPGNVIPLFPPDDTVVVVYIREQLEYMVSSYCQRIQAFPDNTPFLDYARRFPVNYEEFLSGWASAYGLERIKAKVYGQGRFRENDVRRNFMDVIGLSDAGFKFPVRAANPTIGAELIEFKGLVNRFVPRELHHKLDIFRLLRLMAPEFPARVEVSENFADTFRRKFQESNARAFACYLPSEEAFRNRPYNGLPAPVEIEDVVARALDVIDRLAPMTGEALRSLFPTDREELCRFPMLPSNWHEATSIMAQPSPRGRRRSQRAG